MSFSKGYGKNSKIGPGRLSNPIAGKGVKRIPVPIKYDSNLKNANMNAIPKTIVKTIKGVRIKR